MSKLVYCCNCKRFDDCEQAEYCGGCYDGVEDCDDTDWDTED